LLKWTFVILMGLCFVIVLGVSSKIQTRKLSPEYVMK
jgi:hypothetical protein